MRSLSRRSIPCLIAIVFLPATLGYAQSCEPELLSGFGGECYSVGLQGDLVYLSEGKNLTILDVSNPVNPTPISRFTLPFQVYDLAVAGTRTVLSGGNSATEFASIDVTDPIAPELEGLLKLPFTTFDVAVSGDRACVAYGPAGVQLVDLSDPSMPMLGGFLDTPGQTYEIAIQGDLVYAADSFADTLILDASDPAALSVEGFLDLPDGDSPSHVAVVGDKLYLVTYFPSLRVVDISNPKLPQLEGTAPLGGFVKRGLAISGNKALVTDANPPLLSVIDVSLPNAPVVSTTYTLESEPKEVAALDDLAAMVVVPTTFLTDGEGHHGLDLLDLAFPKGASAISNYLTPQYPGFTKAIGSLLYVVDAVTFNKWALNLMDLSRPSLPVTVGVWEIPEEPYEIQGEGNLVYVDLYESGFQILDVSNPSSPQLLNLVETPGLANDLELDGDRIYIADGEAGVSVFDAVNPASPTFVGSWPDGPYEDYAEVIIPVGDLAYVADGAGLHVLDVSNPSSITVVGSEPAFPRVFDMALADGLIYGGLADDGLQIADVTVSSAPVLRGFWDEVDSSSTATLFKLDNRVYLGTGNEGLQIVDVSDPDTPVSCAGFKRPGEYVYVTLSGTFVYVSGSTSGVQIFGLGCQNTPDVNRDTLVDAKDLLLILEAFKRPPTFPQPEDVNCDGVLDTDDVLEFEQAWKTLTGSP